MWQVVKRHFRPEFLNRLDDVVVFEPLGADHLRKIARLQVLTCPCPQQLYSILCLQDRWDRGLRQCLEHNVVDRVLPPRALPSSLWHGRTNLSDTSPEVCCYVKSDAECVAGALCRWAS